MRTILRPERPLMMRIASGATTSGRSLSARPSSNRMRVAFGEKLPDPDEGFTQADVSNEKRREEVYKTIRERLDRFRHQPLSSASVVGVGAHNAPG